MTLTPEQVENFVNIGAFFADPRGDVSEVNTMAATINFLAANPDRAVGPLTTDQEKQLHADVCAFADIDEYGDHLAVED